MRHSFAVQVGPLAFRIGSDWRAPITALERLYAGYPRPVGGMPDHTVRLFAARPWRRRLRPAVHIGGDYMLPEALPLPLGHGLLAAEMGMNLQVALGCRRFLLLHAATVERDGHALLITGESGSGKSTLAALMMARGWRLLGDEFALIGLADDRVHPFPRPISLKNASIAEARNAYPEERFGPLLAGTPKGDIRHLIPDAASIDAAEQPAEVVAILFPRYGAAAETRPVGKAEAFVRLTQASTNYVALGEAGFRVLTGLVRRVPALAIDYPDTATALALAEAAWRAA